MKKFLITLVILCFANPAWSQTTAGKIIFSNRNVPKAAGDGSTYNIPIRIAQSSGETGGGALAGGMKAGLFISGSSTPFVTAILRTDANSMFYAPPANQTVDVPGSVPGQSVTLDFKAWQYVDLTFAESISVGGVTFSTSFTTRPLGGTLDGQSFEIPGVTGLGNENGSGFTLFVWNVPPPWVWRTNNQTIVITSFAGSTTTLTVPDTITDLPVKSIDVGAFRMLFATNVIIPEGIVLLDEAVFLQTSRVRQIQLPNSLHTLGARVFQQSGLDSITIPPAIQSIPPLAFYAATNLANATLPTTLKEIREYAFAACSSLTQITIPENVTLIGTGAFRKSALTKITIPKNVTWIASQAFAECPNLSVVLFMGNRADFQALPEDTFKNSGQGANLILAHAPNATGWANIKFGDHPVIPWTGPIPP